MPSSNAKAAPSRAKAPARKSAASANGKAATTKRPPLTAATADKHHLYQASVQSVEPEIDFVDRTFKRLRGRFASHLREDFCGTLNTSCEWVRRRPTNTAEGVDLDPNPLAWGIANNLSNLTDEQRERITVTLGNVLDAPPADRARDDGLTAPECVLAMNFSYWCFFTRADMLRYFQSAHRSLADDGVFFLDFYGGSDAHKEMQETRKVGKFTYVWDQHKLNPIDGRMQCFIHFRFPDGTALERAFSYSWRLWNLTEIQDVLRDAGFSKVTVYWEGDDGKGGGNGIFRPAKTGSADLAYICYITAEK